MQTSVEVGSPGTGRLYTQLRAEQNKKRERKNLSGLGFLHECGLFQVSKEEGSALAREFNCPFFETSAAYRYYIDDVFHALVREIRRKEKEAVMAMEKKSKPKSSVWKRLKSPFRRKKDSVTWREELLWKRKPGSSHSEPKRLNDNVSAVGLRTDGTSERGSITFTRYYCLKWYSLSSGCLTWDTVTIGLLFVVIFRPDSQNTACVWVTDAGRFLTLHFGMFGHCILEVWVVLRGKKMLNFYPA